jgi:hypothetical protein
MFFGLMDPDPALYPAPDPPINKQKHEEKHYLYGFVTSL